MMSSKASHNSGTLEELLTKAYALLSQNNFNDAKDIFSELNNANPSDVRVIEGLALSHLKLKKYDEAINLYKKLIHLNPQNHQYYNDLGHLYYLVQDSTQALTHYQQALTIHKDYPECLNNLGVVYQSLGENEQALKCYEKSYALENRAIAPIRNMAAIYHNEGDDDNAAIYFKKVVDSGYQDPECYYQLGKYAENHYDVDEALSYYDQALSIKPDYVTCLLDLANVSQQVGDVDKAKRCIDKARSIAPQSSEVMNSLGWINHCEGRFEEALKFYSEALKLKPNYPEYLFNQALLLLLLGDYLQGFKGYDVRHDIEKHVKINRYIQTLPNGDLYNGSQDLNGKTILLIEEQGLGDYLQFIRFAKCLKDKGAVVYVTCREPIRPLLPYIHAVEGLYDGRQYIDYYIPLMSMAYRLGIERNQIPFTDKYIDLPSAVRQSYALLVDSSKSKIGIVWQGNVKNPNNYYRSMGLELFEPLLKLEHLQFYSLQIGDKSTQDKSLLDKYNVIDLENHIHNFLDTAGILSQLDLVVSVDTAVCHLAGAMGIPGYVLISNVPDWRWGLNTSNSYWYQSITVFRQKNSADWHEVINQVKQSLTLNRTTEAKDDLEILKQQARYYNQQGDLSKSLSLCKQIIDRYSHDEKTYALMGNIYFKGQQLNEAEQFYLKALELNANNENVLNNLGTVFQHRQQYNNALSYYHKVLAINPLHIDAILNMGISFQHMGDYDKAKIYYKKVLELNPNLDHAFNNLGVLYQLEYDFESAIDCFKKAINIKADASYFNNLGAVYKLVGQYENAIENYQKALQLAPQNDEYILNHGLLLLLLGDFTRGWKGYEARKSNARHNDMNEFIRSLNGMPIWTGMEELNGKNILIIQEQGLGDYLHFIRYTKKLKEKGARVVVACQDSLVRLFKNVPWIDDIYTKGVSADYYIPIMSLAFCFKTELSNIPNDVPYLFVDDAQKKTMDNYFNDDILNVGLVWGGDNLNTKDNTRSTTLLKLRPLLEMTGVHFYSLQVGTRAKELAMFDFTEHVIDMSEHINDFYDTAAIAQQLDLVISVDTSVAHLVGGLNIPCWLMLERDCDWRWLKERRDSPWYPSITLFRQIEDGDWDTVIDQLAKKLKELRDDSKRAIK